MKKITILLVVAVVVSVNAYARVTLNPLGVSVTETHYTGSSPVAYQTADTLQTAYNDGGKAIISPPASTAYGQGPAIADAVSSSDAGAHVAWPGDFDTPQVGGNLDITFWTAYTGGRALDSIIIFVDNAGNERSFYDFSIQYMEVGGIWTDLVAVEEQLDDGNKTVNQGTVITLDFDGEITNFESLRIWSATSETEFLGWPGHWLATAVEEIDINMVNPPTVVASSDYSPIDSARGIDPDVTLSWTEGAYVAETNGNAVYFGDDYAAVRDADTETTGIFKSLQTANTYTPGTLVDGKTYYWRIDQHNDTYPESPWIGSVNTFTVGLAKYRFDGSMSRETTEAYLARSITWILNENPSQFSEDLRCILNIGAKFMARTAAPWVVVGHPSVPNVADDEYYFDRLALYADLIHAKDSEIILQGCIFESISSAYDTGLSTGTRVRPGIEDIPIPAWVFQEFGQPVVQRNFSYQDMLYTDGYKVDYWMPGDSVPDITRLETRMWTYYRGRRFIDIGYESIHFGQTHETMISRNDPDRSTLYDLLGRLRAYALQNARRGFILCDAHDGHGVVQGGQLLYDIHLAPARPKEQCGTPYEAILEFGWQDNLYGNSVGGTTPSGWYCDSLPYNVEIDNTEINFWDYVGTCGNLTGYHWVWGWDESSWYAHCSESYRNDWLEYAVDWLKTNDPVGYFRMPGNRKLEDWVQDPEGVWTNLYRVNNRPYGFNQEETIKSLWNSDSVGGTTTTYNFVGVTQATNDHFAEAWDVNYFPCGGITSNRNAVAEATDAQYAAIDADDTNQWATTDPGSGDEMFLWIKMKIDEDVADITNIELVFNGNSDGATTNHQMYVMDYDEAWQNNAAWDAVGSTASIPADVDTEMSRNITSNFVDYIDGSGYIIWGVYQVNNSSDDIRVNYIEMNVTTTDALGTDMEDLLLFAASWLEDECPLTVPEADLNGDCKVDLFDFAEFAEKWLD